MVIIEKMDIVEGYIERELGRVFGLGLFNVKLLVNDNREISLRVASLFDSLNCRLKEYLEDKYGLSSSYCERFDSVGDMRSIIVYDGLKECDLDRLYVISKLSR